jgi:hypothetical protein
MLIAVILMVPLRLLASLVGVGLAKSDRNNFTQIGFAARWVWRAKTPSSLWNSPS